MPPALHHKRGLPLQIIHWTLKNHNVWFTENIGHMGTKQKCIWVPENGSSEIPLNNIMGIILRKENIQLYVSNLYFTNLFQKAFWCP